MSTKNWNSKMNLSTNYKTIVFAFLTCSMLCCLTACENSTPTPPKESIGNVAKGLEKTTDFERDTVRVDATSVKKDTLHNLDK